MEAIRDTREGGPRRPLGKVPQPVQEEVIERERLQTSHLKLESPSVPAGKGVGVVPLSENPEWLTQVGKSLF